MSLIAVLRWRKNSKNIYGPQIKIEKLSKTKQTGQLQRSEMIIVLIEQDIEWHIFFDDKTWVNLIFLLDNIKTWQLILKSLSSFLGLVTTPGDHWLSKKKTLWSFILRSNTPKKKSWESFILSTDAHIGECKKVWRKRSKVMLQNSTEVLKTLWQSHNFDMMHVYFII